MFGIEVAMAPSATTATFSAVTPAQSLAPQKEGPEASPPPGQFLPQ